jgi:hypothetical protein
MRDELSPKALAKKTGYTLCGLPLPDKKTVMKIVFGNIDEDEKSELCELVQKLVYPAGQKKIESWMESTFTGNMKLIPVKVAHTCVNVFKIKKRMLPYYISLAQKVKRRVVCREIMRRKKLCKHMDGAGYQ